MNKNAELKNGYNAYIDSSVDDMGTQMDVGLLLMEAGDTYVYEDAKKEVAILLFSGSVTYEWDGKKVEADRPDCFHHDAYCLLAGCGSSDVFNLGNGAGYSVREIIETARRITGKEIKAVVESRRGGDPSVLIASNKKAAEVLGWKPVLGLDQIISDAWAWHSGHPNGYEEG